MENQKIIKRISVTPATPVTHDFLKVSRVLRTRIMRTGVTRTHLHGTREKFTYYSVTGVTVQGHKRARPYCALRWANRRNGFQGLLRCLEQLIQIIPIPYKELSEHVVETIRITRRDYLNDS